MPKSLWFLLRKLKCSVGVNALQHIHKQYENEMSNRGDKVCRWYGVIQGQLQRTTEGSYETGNKKAYEIKEKVKYEINLIFKYSER